MNISEHSRLVKASWREIPKISEQGNLLGLPGKSMAARPPAAKLLFAALCLLFPILTYSGVGGSSGVDGEAEGWVKSTEAWEEWGRRLADGGNVESSQRCRAAAKRLGGDYIDDARGMVLVLSADGPEDVPGACLCLRSSFSMQGLGLGSGFSVWACCYACEGDLHSSM